MIQAQASAAAFTRMRLLAAWACLSLLELLPTGAWAADEIQIYFRELGQAPVEGGVVVRPVMKEIVSQTKLGAMSTSLPTLVPAGDGVAAVYKNVLSTRSALTALYATDVSLDAVMQRELFAESSRLDNVPKELKRESPRSKDKYVWVAVGWLPWMYLGDERKSGGCGPGTWKDVCVERVGNNSYLIKHTSSFSYWSVYGVGISRSSPNSQLLAEKAYNVLASPELSKSLADLFVIVPNNDVRRKRTVVFELYETSSGPRLATTTNTSDPLPVQDKQNTTTPRTTCGNAADACPPYKVAPELAEKVLGWRKRNRQ